MRDVRLVVLALAAALAGCTVGPNYKRPALDLPADYGVAAGTDAQATVAGDWWKQYNDPLLSRLVDTALANNADLRLAVARIDEARGVLRETNALFFPELDAVGTGARQRVGLAGGSAGGTTVSGTGAVRYGNFFQLDGSVSYELDLWGRIRRSSESARASLYATTYARDVTAIAIAAGVAQSYFAIRSLDAQIGVTEGTRAVVDESLGIAKKRLDAGYASGLDYAQAETLRAQILVQLRSLRQQRALQEHALGALVSDLTLRIPVGSLDDIPVPAVPPPGLPSTLLERRPDVRAGEQQVAAANAQIGVATAGLFPRFAISGAYGGQSFQLSDLLKAPFRFWSLGLGITEPIFAGGRYRARVDEARARTDEQVASYQKTVETAFREVADALTNVSESRAAEDEVRVQVDAARRSLRLSRARYDQGYAAYLDVLDATRTANSAELLFVQNRQARLNYSVDLAKALGGGWDDARAGTSPASPAPGDVPAGTLRDARPAR